MPRSPDVRLLLLVLSLLPPLTLATACSGEGESTDRNRSPLGDAGAEAGSAGDGGGMNEQPCARPCAAGSSCDDSTGRCVADCATLTCGLAQTCEAGTQRAECVADCSSVTCDADEECDDSGMAATCVSRCGGQCGEGEACVGSGEEAVCQPRSCGDLGCQLPTLCEPASDGKGGHVCADIRCSSAADCAAGEYCRDDDPDVDEAYCAGSVCGAGSQRCAGDGKTVEECLPNGGGWFERFACLDATCTEDGNAAYCPCNDDWSCPAFTTCEVDRCEGTGAAPTCFVPVVPMENVVPDQEFQWGTNGDRADDTTSDVIGERHPFPQSIHVVTVPMVANLTDDNGDGQVDELDYPEVLFLSYCNPGSSSGYKSNGILRAIHGGGFDGDGNALAGDDFFATATTCDLDFGGGSCDPAAEASWLVWNEGEDGAPDSLDATYGTSGCQNAHDPFDSTSAIAVGNLDGDAAGYPEIVVIGEQADQDDYVFIFDSTGHYVAHSPQTLNDIDNDSGSVAIANLDGEGLPEIIAGRYVWTLKLEGGKLAFDKSFVGDGTENGRNGSANIGPVGCVADLDEDGRQEVIVGATPYTFPEVASCTSPPCTMSPMPGWTPSMSDAVPGQDGFCAVADVWGADPGAPPHPVDNPLDGKPELLVVRSGQLYVLNGQSGATLGKYPIAGTGGGPPNVDDFDGDSMPEIGTAGSKGYSVIDLQAPDTSNGCPAWPNPLGVDNPLTGDFELDRGPKPTPDPSSTGNVARSVPTEGDGSPIVCSNDADCNPGITPHAFACNENTGECVCLHNGWDRVTQDGSSEATGSSVFDFNGDGAAEVVYNDECFFRVYNGVDSRLYSRIPSESRTRSEYPVVADLDNDGNAEIVFGVSSESGQCRKYWDDLNGDGYFVDESGNPYTTDGSDAYPTQPYDGTYNSGLEVWGEPGDQWVSARRIWNQHSYHVTNVTEGGGIPQSETPSWSPLLRTERGFNSYRSNPPSRAGIAPDLQVVEVGVGASGGGCDPLGNEIDIVARIRNAGDLRVGADIPVAFFGTWGATVAPLRDGSGDPLVATLGSPLRPRSELLVRVTYDSTGKTPAGLPDSVEAVVDPDDIERECDGSDTADDNRASAAVETPEPAPDLTLTLDDVTGTCPNRQVELTVSNAGGQDASAISVRLYAGNPDAGGAALGTFLLAGPLPAGESMTDTYDIHVDRDVKLYGTVDPDDTIPECSEGNNDASYADPLSCLGVVVLE